MSQELVSIRGKCSTWARNFKHRIKLLKICKFIVLSCKHVTPTSGWHRRGPGPLQQWELAWQCPSSCWPCGLQTTEHWWQNQSCTTFLPSSRKEQRVSVKQTPFLPTNETHAVLIPKLKSKRLLCRPIYSAALHLTCCRSKSAMGITSAETKIEQRRTPRNCRKAIVMVVLVRVSPEGLQLMCVLEMWGGDVCRLVFYAPKKASPPTPRLPPPPSGLSPEPMRSHPGLELSVMQIAAVTQPAHVDYTQAVASGREWGIDVPTNIPPPTAPFPPILPLHACCVQSLELSKSWWSNLMNKQQVFIRAVSYLCQKHARFRCMCFSLCYGAKSWKDSENKYGRGECFKCRSLILILNVKTNIVGMVRRMSTNVLFISCVTWKYKQGLVEGELHHK